MSQAIVLSFTELPVAVSEESDLACLVRVKASRDALKRKQTVVGRKSIVGRSVKIRTEEGWKDYTPRAVTVIEVVSRE
jgi:hypothetical protein